MHARYYSAGMGRFLSLDPRRLRKGTRVPQRWNRYAYARNNPIKFLDPDGEEALIFLDNQTTGFTRTTFAMDGVARNVSQDFQRAGAAASVSVGKASFFKRLAAALKGDTVHQVTITNSGTHDEQQGRVMGTSQPGTARVFATTHPLDNPDTAVNERETAIANTASHEIGHDLGLNDNTNSPPDLMSTSVEFGMALDLDFNEEDASKLAQEQEE